MNILITGAKGFIGRNLVAELNNIKEEKAKGYGLSPEQWWSEAQRAIAEGA